jgi:hypothetical protein
VPNWVGQQSSVTRRNDLAGTGEFGMVDIHTIVDDGDRDALAARHLVRCLHIGVCVDSHTVECGLPQVPLLRKNGLARPQPDQFGVTVFDVIALEQHLRHIKDLAAGALGGLD